MNKISISFLSSDDVKYDVFNLDKTDADYIHVDVLDGKFTKAKFDPFKRLDYLMPHMFKRLDVHLMTLNPTKYIDEYASLNVEYITIHIEIDSDISPYLARIKSYGIKRGIALNPDTDVNAIIPYLDDINLILVMSVIPGKYGQSYIEGTDKRIMAIKKILKENNKEKIIVSVDGGINDTTVEKVKDADMIVSGSYVLQNQYFQHQIDILRNKCK